MTTILGDGEQHRIGPLMGAMIAVAFEWILKGPPTATGMIAAQGTLERDAGGAHQ